MSTHLELLFTLIALLAGVLYAWIAVQGWQPWRTAAGCDLRARLTQEHDFRDTSPEVAPGPSPAGSPQRTRP